MEIWLSNGTSDKLMLPVNPESIGSNDTRNFDDIVLASGDEKTVIGGKNLKTYSISSFFPSSQRIYSKNRILTPMQYVNKIESWMNAKKILQLQVTTTNINQKVTIRSFNWEEKGGVVGDINYTLEFKEYAPPSYSVIGQKPVNTPTPNKQRPPANKPTAKTHTVVKGDTLWMIAKKHLGDGSKWRIIYNKNKSIIGKNPNAIKPGQKLVIPR